MPWNWYFQELTYGACLEQSDGHVISKASPQAQELCTPKQESCNNWQKNCLVCNIWFVKGEKKVLVT